MNVRAITDQELAAYEALAREQGTVFHSAAWTALFGDRLERYGVFQENGDLVAGFVLQKLRVLGMTVLSNLPFTPQCGPLLRVKAQHPVAILKSRREILAAMAGFLDHGSHALVSLCLDPRVRDALPFVWRKFKVVPRYTYVLDVTASLEELQRNMSAVGRNQISKAIRDGLVVRQATDMAVVQALARGTLGRQHVPARHLEGILFRFANEDNSYAFTTYQGDAAIACCFVIHDTKSAYYLLGGGAAAGTHRGAGAVALFEAIKHAKALGLTTFDFEGSMIPAIETYFRDFGGRLTPYFCVNKAWLPIEILLKFFRRQLF
jgi:hypothetical protein